MTKNKDGTFTITLSAEAIAIIRGICGNVLGSSTTSARKYTDEVYDATTFGNGYNLSNFGKKFLDELDFGKIPAENATLAAIEYGFKNKPAAPKKLRMPDGKYAPANYQVVKYPLHGNGCLSTRHILFGKISGNNVAVQEWNGEEWLPKTYTLSKIQG